MSAERLWTRIEPYKERLCLYRCFLLNDRVARKQRMLNRAAVSVFNYNFEPFEQFTHVEWFYDVIFDAACICS